MKKPTYVFRIRIELLGIDPPVWRRIEVPESYSFWDLHVAIQDAMGWQDSHLHAFRLLGSSERIGIPDEVGGHGTRPGWEALIREVLSAHSPLALYEYDFGDSWLHEIRFEDAVEADSPASYPRCLAGARRCPPENCGGAHRYAQLLRALSDSSEPEHVSARKRFGAGFDPEEFIPEGVTFQDPARRWRAAFNDARELPN